MSKTNLKFQHIVIDCLSYIYLSINPSSLVQTFYNEENTEEVYTFFSQKKSSIEKHSENLN